MAIDQGKIAADERTVTEALHHFATRTQSDDCEEYAQVVSKLENAADWLRNLKKRLNLDNPQSPQQPVHQPPPSVARGTTSKPPE